MLSANTNGNRPWRWKKIVQYLLQGVLVVAPIAITAYLLYWFFSSIDSLLPIFREKDETGRVINRNYGLGFVVVVVTLIVVGYLSSNFLASRLLGIFDSLLERAPGIKFIYSSIKDFFEAFAGNKKKFTNAVLVNILAPDVWQIGFITDEEVNQFGLAEYVSVYVPQAYAFAGHLVILPRHKIRKLPGISSADAMKYAVSGGVTEVEEEIKKTAFPP